MKRKALILSAAFWALACGASAETAPAPTPPTVTARIVEDTYAFARSAGQEAVAMAVMIDGHYSVEHLVPFPDEKN